MVFLRMLLRLRRLRNHKDSSGFALRMTMGILLNYHIIYGVRFFGLCPQNDRGDVILREAKDLLKKVLPFNKKIVYYI